MRFMGWMRARRLPVVAGLVLALGAGGVACGSDEKAEKATFVGAAEVCNGLFAGSLAKKVESVTGDMVFYNRGDKGLDNVVDVLKRGYASGRSWGPGAELCRLAPKGGGLRERGGFRFSMYAPKDVMDSRISAGSVLYSMGKKSEARQSSASLYLECVSLQLEGASKNPLRIYGSFVHGESDAPDTREVREANLEILHAAALAVVKKLECENNAGLAEKPVLEPRT